LCIYKTILFLFIFSFFLRTGYAQPFPQLRFQHLAEKDGLSNKNVYYTTQDEKGFLWMGTLNGLNRYDGYRFKQLYHQEGDSASLPHNIISYIVPGEKNHLWVSTKNGLAHLNTLTYQCKNVLAKANTPGRVPEDGDIWPFTGEPGTVLLATLKGLYRLNSDFSATLIPQQMKPFQYFSAYETQPAGLFKDRAGRLWAGCANRLCLLDAATKKVVQTFITPSPNGITNFYAGDDNNLWLSTWGAGVYKFNIITQQFSPVPLDQPALIAGKISDWTVNGKKYIVICTLGAGIYLLDTATMQYKNYLNDDEGKPLLTSSHVNHVFVDRQNTLWLSTNNGVAYVTPFSGMFTVIRLQDEAPDRNRIIKNFYEAGSGYWISKWDMGGHSLYSKNWQLQKFILNLDGDKRIKPNMTSQAYFTMPWKNDLYFCTDSGLVRLNPVTYQTTRFYPSFVPFRTDLKNIVPLSDSIWWLRSHEYGIFVFNVAQQRFTGHYANKDSCTNCLPESHYEFLLKTSKGVVWVSTENGLYEYLPAANQFKNYRRNEGDAVTFPSNKLSGMAEDGNGNLWVGTSMGICLFNTASKKVEKVFADNKYVSSVFRVCADGYGNMWFNSRTGIWCWLQKQDKLIKFGEAAGIPPGFENGILEKTSDGSMYAGCSNALVQFNPQKIMNYAQNATTQITDVSIDNKTAIVSYNGEKKLELPPGAVTFTVDFTVLNYDFAENNQYFYRLLPQSAKWIENNTGHLNFYNLPPGTYHLEVKGSNKLSNVNTEADRLTVIVNPFWHQTLWFKTACALAIAGLVFYFVRRRIRTVKKEASLKQKIAETEMLALRAQMNPHFIFNCLNSIDNLVQTGQKEAATTYLAKFAKLIRAILENSKHNTLPCWKDMETLQLYLQLEQLRWSDKFTHTITVANELMQGDYQVPPLVVQPFVENALHHGLLNKKTPDGRLTVSVSLREQYIYYIIEDNGVGRAQAAAYKNLNQPAHESMGMNITLQRINIFNRHLPGAVTITDLLDAQQQPAGTRVEVKIIQTI
jgi:ligand-binding sensor domain-containing protein/anti-sigma regulatory factor (Ser/Thr protein kinase)